MKRLVCPLVALAGFSLFADNVFWQSDGSSYDGNFTNALHWSTGAVPMETNEVYIGGNLSANYTVTFSPEEYFFPAKKLGVGVYAGHTVNVNGRGATLKTQALPNGGTFTGTPFCLYNRGWNEHVVKFQLSSATPDAYTGPIFELSDFAFSLSSEEVTDIKAEFAAGTYNFLNPSGKQWTSLPTRPILFLLDFNNNNYKMKKGEVVFGAGTHLSAPTLGVTGNAETNVVRFTGANSTHTVQSLAIPCRYDGQTINENRTVTDIVVDNGASLTMTSYSNLHDSAPSTNRFSRIIAGSNGSVSFNTIYPSYGELSFIADGGCLSFDGGNQDFHSTTYAKFKTVSLEARNGGTVCINQQDTDAGLYMGAGESVKSNVGKSNILFEDAALDIRKNAKLDIYNGAAIFRNTAITNAGTFNFCSRGTYNDLNVLIDSSTLTNAAGASLTFGSSAQANHLVITNSTLDLNAMAYIRRFPVTDIYDTTIRLLAGGCFQVSGSMYSTPSTVNLHSGRMTTWSTTAYNGYIGNDNNGVGIVNVYGGYWEFGLLHMANTYVPEGYEKVETSLNIHGGEVYVKCAGNGDGVGFRVCGHGSRTNVHLRLNGGLLRSYTTFGGSGVTYLEANGGTVAPPPKYDTPYLLHGFTHATVGPKGLAIDNAAASVTVSQASFADAADAAGTGRILSKGTGTTRFTGDLSGVSYLVAQEGTLDLTRLATNATTGCQIGSLVSTNGATLKMNLAQTIEAAGTVILDATKIILTANTVAADQSYDLIHYQTAASAATREALARGLVTLDASAVPSGTKAIFEEVADETNGGCILRLTCRVSQVAKTIAVTEGDVTNAEAVVFSRYDRIAADVSKDASLTLTGANRYGAVDKFGDGNLFLSAVGSQYLGGLNLWRGAIVLGDDTGTLGDASATSVLSNGVLRIAGPETGVTLPGSFLLAETTSNDVVIVNNEVDVTMAAPSGTASSLHTANPSDEYSGSFIKRGAGTLTWNVSGSVVLPGGLGNTIYGGTFWPYMEPDSRCKPFVFDETTGVLTSGSHPAITIYEGCLKMVGQGTGAKVSTSGVVALGMAGSDGSVQPGLILDNVTLAYTHWGNRWMIAPGIYSYSETDPSFITDPYVILTNKATLSAYALYLNRLARSDGALTSTISVLGGSTLACTTLSPNRCAYERKASKSEINVVDSTVAVGNDSGGGNIELFQPATFNFNNSVLKGNRSPSTTAAGYARIRPDDGVTAPVSAYATFNFTNGSECRCRSVLYYEKASSPISFTFDDSAWIAGTGDFDFVWADPTKISIAANGKGLKLPVPAGKTWSLAQPVTGAGAVVNSGTGTLKLTNGFNRVSGPIIANSGATVDLDSAAHQIYVGGAGTFANGSIAAGGGLVVEVDDDYQPGDLPTLSNVALPTQTRVTLGRTAENPLVEPYQPFVVYRYTGTAPDVSKWRLTGTGVTGLGGDFTAKDGVVTVTPVKKGVTFLLQ